MGFVIFDTYVLLQAFKKIDPHANALETLDRICDKVALSQPIEKEFKNKLHSEGLTLVLFQGKLSEISRKKKLIKIRRTNLNKAKQKIQNDHLPLPNDRYDHKFIEAAVAIHADYIITTDHALLSMNPYKYGNFIIEIIPPNDYVQKSAE